MRRVGELESGLELRVKWDGPLFQTFTLLDGQSGGGQVDIRRHQGQNFADPQTGSPLNQSAQSEYAVELRYRRFDFGRQHVFNRPGQGSGAQLSYGRSVNP